MDIRRGGPFDRGRAVWGQGWSPKHANMGAGLGTVPRVGGRPSSKGAAGGGPGGGRAGPRSQLALRKLPWLRLGSSFWAVGSGVA